MTYRFDPELAPWIAELPAIDLSDPARVRAASAVQRSQAPVYESPIPLTVEDRLVPGLENDPDVPVRVYAPAGRSEALPGLLYIHGGGFVIGSVDGDDARTREIAAMAEAVVVSVEYRLAPEHPFPAGFVTAPRRWPIWSRTRRSWASTRGISAWRATVRARG